ncbi:hypothetical protein [Winogradskyella psychrotolerans]|uniref:hypothetical protein n=1 Tax=Winogradskyella psychrotolerans TaxID=1344585 RepID=UPI001C06F480|nr:hypothetical protein [Winogradskyella psychrotolerans]MBU2927045.1 hypothetical protein [Winogradskyella psychrotolerans]
MRILLTFLALLLVQSVFADQPRLRYSFKSSNGEFELKPSDTIFSDNKIYTDSIFNPNTKKYLISSYSYPDRYYWGLYNLKTNKLLYKIKNDSLFIETKTALISDNGQNIIIVDDYSGGFAIPNFEVIHFYDKDELTKTLTLGELLNNMCSVSYSVSHMRWSFDFNIIEKNMFEIETYEFYNYTFDLKGNLIKKISDNRIQEKDDIVTAKIRRLEKDKYSFKIIKSIRNNHEPETELIVVISDRTIRKIHGKFYGFLPSRNKKMETEFYKTVLFKNGKPINSEFRFPTYNGKEYCNLANKKTAGNTVYN